MKDEKFDDYIDTPYFASMDEVDALVGPVWEAYHEEAKRLLACNHSPEAKDNEKVSLHHTVTIISDMISDAEKGLRRARTEKEAKVQYAMLRTLLARRNEVEDALHDAAIITSMMYQEEGATLSWIK